MAVADAGEVTTGPEGVEDGHRSHLGRAITDERAALRESLWPLSYGSAILVGLAMGVVIAFDHYWTKRALGHPHFLAIAIAAAGLATAAEVIKLAARGSSQNVAILIAVLTIATGLAQTVETSGSGKSQTRHHTRTAPKPVIRPTQHRLPLTAQTILRNIGLNQCAIAKAAPRAKSIRCGNRGSFENVRVSWLPNVGVARTRYRHDLFWIGPPKHWIEWYRGHRAYIFKCRGRGGARFAIRYRQSIVLGWHSGPRDWHPPNHWLHHV